MENYVYAYLVIVSYAYLICYAYLIVSALLTYTYLGTLQKVTFCNCNYKAATELCSTTTIHRTARATDNYNAYYAKLQQHYGT